MKTKSLILSTIMFFSIAGLSAQSKGGSRKQEVIFSVHMHCENCKNKIEKNIAFEKGVKALSVSLEEQTVVVVFDNRRTSVEALQTAFKNSGYEAKLPSIGCCTGKKECLKEKK